MKVNYGFLCFTLMRLSKTTAEIYKYFYGVFFYFFPEGVEMEEVLSRKKLEFSFYHTSSKKENPDSPIGHDIRIGFHRVAIDAQNITENLIQIRNTYNSDLFFRWSPPLDEQIQKHLSGGII